MEKITVYGAGAFGFAMARHLGKKREVFLYDIDAEMIERMKEARCQPYHFPDALLSPGVKVTGSLDEALEDVDIVFLAIPAQTIRETMKTIGPSLEGKIVINGAKALEEETGKRISEIILEEVHCIPAVFSGGTIAGEMLLDKPLSADVAADNSMVIRSLQNILSSETLRVYGSLDMVGVEYAGAFKNVIAIASGISIGMELPLGSTTAIISRSSKEARDLAVALGGKEYTFGTDSQCWGNDLWMSCLGKTRNKYFGELLGKRMSVEEALLLMKKEHKTVEGYGTAHIVHTLARKQGLDAPVFQALYAILYEDKSPKDAVKELMMRELKMVR